MSTEIHVATALLHASEHEGLTPPAELTPEDERVLHTAGDRPNTATLPALADPAVDHLDEALAARRDDINEKHGRVAEFLEANGFDALVLNRADSVAWFTSGGDLGRSMSSEQAAVSLFINRQSRAVLCDNVQSARVFEEEVGGLGFQLKEQPWHDDPNRLATQLGHNKRVATDTSTSAFWPNVYDQLLELRCPLTSLERQRLRMLGRTLTLAIEATCRNFHPGETEADIAGHLAHRLLREGVVPVDLRVAGDDRLARYHQPSFKAAEIRHRATITAVGRRHGLCAAATRTVSFGRLDRGFRDAHALASMVGASCIFFSRPGETVSEVFRRAKRIYEKYGHPDEWMLDYQGVAIGYAPCEAMLRPDSSMELVHGTALSWSPSVGPARSEDTMVVDERGYEVVTEAQSWPKIEVTVKGLVIPRPGILER